MPTETKPTTKTSYEVRSTATEVAIYEIESGNRYLRMDNRSFASRQDCLDCANLIANFLTNVQKWGFSK